MNNSLTFEQWLYIITVAGTLIGAFILINFMLQAYRHRRRSRRRREDYITSNPSNNGSY